jgi:uncharacterized membrane protein
MSDVEQNHAELDEKAPVYFKPERSLRKNLWLVFYLVCAWQLVWHLLWVSPKKLHIGLVLAFALVPLIPAAVLRPFRAQAALVAAGFGVLLHLIYASMEATLGGPARAPAMVQTLICIVFFALWAKIVRSEKRSIKDQQTSQQN